MRKKTGRNKKMDANECVEKRTEGVEVSIVIACTPVHLPGEGTPGSKIKERGDGITRENYYSWQWRCTEAVTCKLGFWQDSDGKHALEKHHHELSKYVSKHRPSQANVRQSGNEALM